MKEKTYKELCEDVWKLMYTTGMSKGDAITQVYTSNRIGLPLYECFACESTIPEGPNWDSTPVCDECPIRWTDIPKYDLIECACEEAPDSPYAIYWKGKKSMSPTQLKLIAYEVYRQIITTWEPVKKEYSS